MAYFIVKIAGQPGFHIVDEAGLDGITPDTPGITVATLDVASNTEVTTSPGFADPSELSIDPHPAMFRGAPMEVDGFVYVLNTDTELANLEKDVPFSGTAATAYNGATVEGRLITEDGLSLTGWQPLGTVTAGAYSGTITCPAVGPLAYKDVRIASADLMQRYRKADGSPARCRVGVAIDVAGRSQTSIPAQSWWQASSSYAVEIGPEPVIADDEFGLCSYLGIGGINRSTDGMTSDGHTVVDEYYKYGIIGDPVMTGVKTTDYHTMINIQKQWARLSPNVGAVFMVNAHNSNEPMADYDDFADMLGMQNISITVGRNDSATDYPIPDPNGAGTAAALAENCLRRAASMPFAREGGTVVLTGNVKGQLYSRFNNSSDSTIDFPLASQIMGGAGVVGPAMPGIRQAGASGNLAPVEWSAHPKKHDYMGTLYESTMLPVAAARGLGFDTSKNPYFDAPMFNQDRTQIRIRIVPENGGEIACKNPAQVSNFAVVTGGTPDWTGFSAMQSGEYVYLSKTDISTPWPVGAYVHMDSNGQPPAADNALETRLLNGTIFETWEPDIYGKGLQVCGTKDETSGYWVGELYEVPATWSNAMEEFPTKESLELFFADDSNFGRTSTNPLKVPGVDDLPPGTTYNPTTKIIKVTANAVAIFEDWDLRGCTFRMVSTDPSTGRVSFRQCLFDNQNLNTANGAVIQMNASYLDIVEFCDFISDGDSEGSKCTKPIAQSPNNTSLGQLTVRNCRFENWPSDAVDGPFRIIERNYFKATSMLHFEPDAWDSETTYDTGDYVTLNGYAYRARMDGVVGNAPSGGDSTNTWWTVNNPHCDMITLQGTVDGWPAIIQYNYIDMSLDDVPVGYRPTKTNNYIRTPGTASSIAYGPVAIFRKNIGLYDPTRSSNIFEPISGSKLLIEGNWLQPGGFGSSYMSGSGSGPYYWGTNNYNVDTGTAIPKPTAAIAWP